MSNRQVLVLILLGPPGSGKGTQSEFISQYYSLRHISTGELFRKQLKERSSISQELDSYISQGKLVPDELVIKTVSSFLLPESKDSKGYILDGFPRTVIQAERLHELLKTKNIKCVVLNLIISEKIAVQRLSSRLTCSACGKIFHKTKDVHEGSLCPHCSLGHLTLRLDDSAEIISTRFKIYDEKTKPIEAFYKNLGILNNLNAEQTSEKIFEDIKNLLPLSEY